MGSPLYFSHPACVEHETTVGHPERSARIMAIERSLAERDWLAYEVRQAPPASRELLVAVHSAEYVDAVRSMSDRGAGAFDPANRGERRVLPRRGTPVRRCVCHGEGAAGRRRPSRGLLRNEAARAARVHGHHVRIQQRCGGESSRAGLVGRTTGVHLRPSVHYGDGTNDIFRATNAVLFASIHQSGAFPVTGPIIDAGARAGEGYSINLPVQKGSSEDAWFSLLEHIVIPRR
jgi:acetoin utilization deacetylase AcuC-like enzyme